jgi:hypothetical protein
MEANEMLEHHMLIISENVLNSIVSFVMDTLVQRREMLGQLQGEVATLRTQVEGIQLRSSPTNFGSGSAMVILSKRDAPSILVLNALTTTSENDEGPNDRTPLE